MHLLAGASMGLSVDEAHYALYALHPALSYFDHPPLVGWIQWPLVMLDASTALLRVLPAMLWLGTALAARSVAMRLVPRAEDWRWSSLWRRRNFCADDFLHDWPVPCPANWIEHVNQPQSETELAAVRWAVRRGAPFGSDTWRAEGARLLGVNPEFRGRGRPPKTH